MGEIGFSLVLPAYNEADAIEAAVKQASAALAGIDYEIIIAEDGSRDGTDKIAAKLAKQDHRVLHLHSTAKLGRGKALSVAFQKARGRLVAYMDVDLATNPRHLKEMIAALGEYDVVIGSRYKKGADSKRTAKRLALSKGFNAIVKTILGSRVSDHQCGFKGFRRSVALKLCGLARENHWFWDTEVVVLAQKLGYSVYELPVEWRESGVTKVNFRRDVVDMGTAAIRMKMRRYDDRS